MRLVGTYHGQRMYVFGRLRCRQRDETKEEGGRAGVRAFGRSAGSIDNAGRIAPGLPFLIGVIKRIDYVQEKV